MTLMSSSFSRIISAYENKVSEKKRGSRTKRGAGPGLRKYLLER